VVLWLAVVTVVLVLVAVVVLVTVIVLVIASHAGAGLATGPIVSFVSFSRLDLPGFRAGGDHVSMAEVGGLGMEVEVVVAAVVVLGRSGGRGG
jgi:hypothetical protein